MGDNSFLTVIFGTLVMCAALFGFYLLSRKLGKGMPLKRQSRYSRVLDRIVLGKDKYIEFLEIGEHVLVLGISPASVELLDKLRTDELRTFAEEGSGETFANILNRFLKK